MAKCPPYFWLALHRTKVRWRFRKILWPSQNIWTLSNIRRLRRHNLKELVNLFSCTHKTIILVCCLLQLFLARLIQIQASFHRSCTFCTWSIITSMDFISRISFSNEPLISGTFLGHFCHHFWVGATAKQQQTHSKVMTKMVKKC